MIARLLGLPTQKELETYAVGIQLIFLVSYLLVMIGAGACIAEGSDRLLDLWGPGMVAGILIPLAGCISEATVTVIAGTGKCAQEGLDIGIGTLGGSTIMLLTIPLGLAMFMARGDINEETKHVNIDSSTNEFINTNEFSACQTSGVELHESTHSNAKLLMLSGLPYLALAIPALIFRRRLHENSEDVWPSLVTFIISGIGLTGYAMYHMYQSFNQDIQEIPDPSEQQVLVRNNSDSRVSNPLDETSESQLMLHEKPNPCQQTFTFFMSRFDRFMDRLDDGTGRRKAVIIAWLYWLSGTGIILSFSGPLVDTMSAISTSLYIRSYYVSFFVVPFIGNISESIAALRIASRRTKHGISVAFSVLYGAAAVNNTLLLGLLAGLVFFQKLQWVYAAETLMIIIVIFFAGCIGLLRTPRLWFATCLMLMYPLAVLVVRLTEVPLDGPVPPPKCHKNQF